MFLSGSYQKRHKYLSYLIKPLYFEVFLLKQPILHVHPNRYFFKGQSCPSAFLFSRNNYNMFNILLSDISSLGIINWVSSLEDEYSTLFLLPPTLTIPSAHLISTLPSSKDIMVMLSFWIDKIFQLSSFRSLSYVRLFATPWTAALQASLSITNSQSLLKLVSIESMMPSNYLILCCPLLLPSVFPNIMVFSSESVLRIRLPKCWSFSFGISPSNEYSGLISFRIDWFDLLAVQTQMVYKTDLCNALCMLYPFFGNILFFPGDDI